MKNFKKKTAQILVRKFQYFKGKDKISRFLFSHSQTLESGEIFKINYFRKRYQAITSYNIVWGIFFYEGLKKNLINCIYSKLSEFDNFFYIHSNYETIIEQLNNLKKIYFSTHNFINKKLIIIFKIFETYINQVILK